MIFAIRYRRGSNAKRGPLPEIVSREFEIGWTSATLFLFAFLVLVGGLRRYHGPRGARQRARNACRRQAMDVEDPALERRTRDRRAARSGRPAGAAGDDIAGRHPLVLRSGVPRQAGRTAGASTPRSGSRRPRLGVFPLLCAEYCGTDHSAMRGRIVVMRPGRLCRLADPTARGRRSRPCGRQAFRRPAAARAVMQRPRRCTRPSSPAFTAASCSSRTAARSRPTTRYIRDSILQPKRDIVAGLRADHAELCRTSR